MKIAPPAPTPPQKKLTPGRPKSRLFAALTKLDIGQCVVVTFARGDVPTIQSARSQISGWSAHLGFRLSHRTDAKGRLIIARVA